jgi:decaprenylphospho-beta-D-erythro-pentofuranosid-2-ulose 2-reductase
MHNMLIIGATSAMAKEVARLWAQRAGGLYLLARSEPALAVLAADLKVRGAQAVHYAPFEANDFAAHAAYIDLAFNRCGKIDVVLVCHGTLPDQTACERSASTTLDALSTNGVSVLSLLTHIANRLETQGNGTIAVISSVAGDRGRQSNYVYGAAKAMVSVFLQGLRNRLFHRGISVLDIRPGFVDTPMTAQFGKSALWAQPADVAADILKAIDKQRDVIYTPWFWRWIMALIRAVPESIFKRLKL